MVGERVEFGRRFANAARKNLRSKAKASGPFVPQGKLKPGRYKINPATPSEFRFEFLEAALQFPLLLGFLAGFQRGFAGYIWRCGAWSVVCARRDSGCEIVLRAPQTLAGKKTVLEAAAD